MGKGASDCPKCGGAVSPPGKAGGRPSRFCSEGCKASAEAEMRRMNVLLRKLEERRALAVVEAPTRVSTGLDKYLADLDARYSRAIGEAQSRYDHLAGVPAAATEEVAQ